MLNAIKDYNETCLKPSLGRIKRHRNGYTLFAVGMYAVAYGIVVYKCWKIHKGTDDLVKKSEGES